MEKAGRRWNRPPSGALPPSSGALWRTRWRAGAPKRFWCDEGLIGFRSSDAEAVCKIVQNCAKEELFAGQQGIDYEDDDEEEDD